METTQHTSQQFATFLGDIADRYPQTAEPGLMTDIRLRVSADSGELLALDDDDTEIARVIIEQWIDSPDDNFHDRAARQLRAMLEQNAPLAGSLGILKPYSFILESEDGEHISELYVADDDTIIIGGDLMEGLDRDLDAFFDTLFASEA